MLFEHAVAPAPLTLPAHSSLFTGKYPPQHGVRDNGGFFLDERETTLAERLKARGLKTGGFVGAYVLDRTWGIAQGFDTYFDNFDLSKFDSAVACRRSSVPRNEVADRALAWLETVKSVAILRLGPFLRRAFAVRAARAVPHAVRRSTRTSARSRSSIRRSPASAPSSKPSVCSTGRWSSCWAITARASATTARARTGSSSTSRCCTSR